MTELGILGSATYATTLSGIDEMMNVLPNNDANLISARDVRDVVLTLYDDIQSATSSEFFYTNPATITNFIGNWRVPNARGWPGTFSNVSLQELFDNIFYIDSGPSAGLSFNPSISTTLDFKQEGSTEYSSTTGFDEIVGSFGLRWSATARTYNLKPGGVINRSPAPTIVPDGRSGNPLFNVAVPPRGGTDTVGPTKIRINQTNTFTFEIEDEKGNDASSSLTVTYGNRIYWGRRPSLDFFTTSSEIRNLDGAGISQKGSPVVANKGFASAFTGTYDRIDGAGQHICWAWPSSFGSNPTFTVNGLAVRGDIFRLQADFSYKNIYGYEELYDIWITRTTQGSPIQSFIIGT